MYKDEEGQQNEEENWSRIKLGITWIQAQSLRKHVRKYELRIWISQLDGVEWSVVHSGRLTPFPTDQDAVWPLKPVLSFWEQKKLSLTGIKHRFFDRPTRTLFMSYGVVKGTEYCVSYECCYNGVMQR